MMKQRQPVASEMDPRLVTLLLIAFIGCLVSGIVGMAVPCKNCAVQKQRTEETLSAEQLKNARIELIKKQILSKLKLEHPPKLNKSTIPNIITNGVILGNPEEEVVIHDGNIDDYYGTTQNIVLLSENTTSHLCPQATSQSVCFYFYVDPSKVSTESIASAYLWIYRKEQEQRNLTYTLYNIQYKTNESEYWQRVLREDRMEWVRPGWYKINIARTLSNWLNSYQIFKMDCDGCDDQPIETDSDNRPFIVINTDATMRVNRRKRNVDCTEQSTGCCREQFFLAFSDIGWNDWIIQPPGYTANYCKGNCIDDASLTRFHHTTVIQQHLQKMKAKNESTPLSLCCSPSRLSSISLIYMDENQAIFQKVLPNMIVEACDCV
ncbi:growth/differentiation factor 8-like [Centruroides vittatus]|uniref:growth/differentiation factor 8-like n=1 Tax=Centruroides vittatus TaxID=120091 RepID=UPI003510BABF